MTSLLTKLFPPRRNRHARRQPGPARRPARLGVEGLEAREVPSATSSFDFLTGRLTVTGDGANDNIVVGPKTTRVGGGLFGSITVTDPINLEVRDLTTGAVATYPRPFVRQIEFTTGAGSDRAENRTDIPATFRDGAGNDVYVGGSAGDVFHAGPGANTFVGGGGRDVLYRHGYRGYFADGNATDGDLTVGRVSGRPSPAELGAVGGLTASLDRPSGQPGRVVLNGPSGAGFALRGDWAKDAGGFTTTGPITLETTYGDVTLPAAPGGAARVDVSGWSPAGDAGAFRGISWNSLPVTGTTNPLNAVLDRATGGIGLDLNLPGVSWGIGLGSEVKKLDREAPVNAAVPYLYARTDSGFALDYGAVKVEAPYRYTGTFVFGPGDGTVYAAVGLPAGEFAVAVSPQGTIRYEPDRLPNGMTDPAIYGHYYVRGALSLADAGIPVGLKGEMVVDLDANDDGVAAGLTPAAVSGALRRFTGGLRSSVDGLADLGRTVMSDVAVGFNGGIDLKLKVLTVEMGTASVWYKPGQVGFRATSTNPFAKDAILKTVMGGGGYDLQGYMTWAGDSRNWYFRADAHNSGLLGLSASGLYVEAGNSILGGGGLRAGAWVPGPLGTTLRVAGDIGFNGNFTLTGSASLTPKSVGSNGFSASVGGSATLTLKRTGGVVSIGASIYVSASASLTAVGRAGAEFTAHVGASVGSDGRLRFSGSGSVTGWYDPAGPAKRRNVSVGYSLTENSLKLNLPVLPDPTFRW